MIFFPNLKMGGKILSSMQTLIIFQGNREVVDALPGRASLLEMGGPEVSIGCVINRGQYPLSRPLR